MNILHYTNKAFNRNGFTLIETLVYVALFGLLMSGVVVSVMGIVEGGYRLEARTLLHDEGTFLLAKINWATTGGVILNPPLGAQSATELEVSKHDGTITITLVSDSLVLKRGIAPLHALNTGNVTVSNLLFDHQGSSSGVEWLTVHYTLATNTQDGKLVQQDFNITTYARK